MGNKSITAGVFSYDVVKGPWRENQKAHGVHLRQAKRSWGKVSSHELTTTAVAPETFTTIGIPGQYLELFLVK